MSAFRRDDDGRLRAIFTSQESHVLINLTEQLLELLGEGASQISQEADPFLHLVGFGANDAPPEDPVLRRLLPDAYDDIEAAAEFRRYTEHGLREKKRAHALTIYEALIPQDEEWNADNPIDRGSIEIDIAPIQVMDWLSGLNDLRLALAVRLGIEKNENPSRLKSDSPQSRTHTSGSDEGDESADGASGTAKRFELMKESDPMKAVYAVYNWLGSIQQSLIETLNP